MNLENGTGKAGFNAKMAFLAPFVVVVALAVFVTALITIGMSGHFSAREKAITQAAYSEIARANKGRLPENIACDPPADLRTSDLCAQWKAADAADKGQLWGFWSMAAALLAAGVSGASLWFLRLNLKEMRLQSQQEFRSYIEATIDGINIDKDDIAVDIYVRNYGRTPAINVNYRVIVRVCKNLIRTTEFNNKNDWKKVCFDGVISELHPSRINITKDMCFNHGNIVIKDSIEDTFPIVIYYSVEYKDVFGLHRETNDVRYYFVTRNNASWIAEEVPFVKNMIAANIEGEAEFKAVQKVNLAKR